MKELNKLIQTLFNTLPFDKEIKKLKENYNSLINLQNDLIIKNILEDMENVTKEPKSQIRLLNDDIDYILKKKLFIHKDVKEI